MRRIAAMIPLWNQELFIKPHIDMLRNGVDHILVLLQGGPLPSYKKEHGYSAKPDASEKIIRHYFPDVEIRKSTFPWQIMEFSSPLYNEGLSTLVDYDLVLRLDPDMFFLKSDWEKFIGLMKNSDYECYRMDFSKNSVNYYMTGDFEHGLKDAHEFDPLAVSPKKMFTGILDYPSSRTCVYTQGFDENFAFHHFRGWNKPKSTGPDWPQSAYAKEAFEKYSNNGEWYHCPEEIRTTMETWMEELKQWQNV